MKNAKTRKLVFSAAALALAFVTSFIKLLDLPMGGSVTLLSMFFISLAGYWYGPLWGLGSAFVYGVLQFIVEPYILSVPQVLCDYFFAFTALGLSGLFFKAKFKLSFGPFVIDRLQVGYLGAVLGRYLFSFLSGWIFFGMYAPDTFPSAVVYSLAYNGAYLGLEAAITIVIVTFIPPFRKAIDIVGRI